MARSWLASAGRGARARSAHRSRRRAWSLAPLVGLALAGSCGETAGSLCGVPIEDVVVAALIVETDTITLVEMSLGTPDDLMTSEQGTSASGTRFLCDGDKITVNGTTARLIDRTAGGPVYSVSLGSATPQYTMRFDIDGESVSYTATVDVALDVIAPAPGVTLSRAEPVALQWAPPAQSEGDFVIVDVRDEIDGFVCLAPFEALVVGEGEGVTLEAGRIAAAEEVDPAITCDANLQLTRTADLSFAPDSGNKANLNAASAAVALVLQVIPFRSVP